MIINKPTVVFDIETTGLDIIKDRIIDICTILEKCSIDEISKFLIKEGKKRKFPDLTLRE